MFRLVTVLSCLCCVLLYGQDGKKADVSGPRLALDGDCPVSLVEMNAYVKGEEKIQSTYRGLRYYFLSEEEKQVFDQNPEIYAVAFGGIDIVATQDKEKVLGTGRHTHRYENRTFHFTNNENRRAFVKTPNEYIFAAQRMLYRESEIKRGKTLAELYPGS